MAAHVELRELTPVEVYNLGELIRVTNERHRDLKVRGQSWIGRHVDVMTQANSNLRLTGTTGMFGLIVDGKIKGMTSTVAWERLRYYTMANSRSVAGLGSQLLRLFEHVVQTMEERGYYTFFYSTTVRGPHDVANGQLKSRIFLTSIPERYDIVVEKFRDVGACQTMTDIAGHDPDAIVFRGTLRSELRPYQPALIH